MNWIKSHLNWSLFLGVCILGLIAYPLLVLLASAEITWGFWCVFIIGMLFYYGIFDYVLSEKGKKKHGKIMNFGWFILWLTGWLGIIVLLSIKGKRS